MRRIEPNAAFKQSIVLTPVASDIAMAAAEAAAPGAVVAVASGKPKKAPCYSGISSVKEAVKSRDLIIWSDNTGAESAMRGGALFPFPGERHIVCLCTIWCQALHGVSTIHVLYMHTYARTKGCIKCAIRR